MIVSGGADASSPVPTIHSAKLLAAASTSFAPADTTCDDACFWLYSSGSTGAPKGTVHMHSSLIATAELYAKPILGIREDDVVFSAAKLFFAYGLGNGLTFPMSVGATTVLMAERPTPAAVVRAPAQAPADDLLRRADAVCGAARKPRPARARRAADASLHVGRRGAAGRHRHAAGPSISASRSSTALGSTEMLHIFLSNRPGEVRYGTTGKPVPGYELRIVGDDGQPVAPGEVGELQINGPTCGDGLLEQPREDAGTRSRAHGRAAATSTRSTPTATMSTRAGPTTC